MPANEAIKIGDLRYEVTLARRTHEPSEDLDNPVLVEKFSDRKTLWANIVPVGTMVFLNSKQTPTEGTQSDINAITHRITVRWRAGLDSYNVILRETRLPDGSKREDVFRIHRIGEWNGRTRFLLLDAELEQKTEGGF